MKFIEGLYFAIRNLYKLLVILAIDFIIKRKPVELKHNTLLLIRLDAIGDYIMFRNFIKAIKDDSRYKNHKITLCGNVIWRDLALTFDKEIVFDFIWIDRIKYLNSIPYRYRIMKQVYESGFETAIETIHSREILFGDSIIKASGSKVKVGTKINDPYSKIKKGIFADHWYTELISVSSGEMFEFTRTKQFFESLLGYKIEIKKPRLNTSAVPPSSEITNKYVVLFPGASRKDKIWDVHNFRSVAEFIIDEYSYDIVVSGSIKEKTLADEVKPSNSGENFTNLCGNTLTELAKLISGAELLISNDTSAIHFAAAVDVPFICIANGFYYGRFYPYPEDVFSKAWFIYPDNFSPGETKSINNIKPEKVKSLIKEILN